MNINFPQTIINGTFSNPKKNSPYQKAKIQKIQLKGKNQYQITYYTSSQVFHTNVCEEELNTSLNAMLEEMFLDAQVVTEEFTYFYRITKKGTLLTNRKAVHTEMIIPEHNRKKEYLLPEGKVIPPLVDLGVMTLDGKLVKAKIQKFKQINRFLEIVEDSIQNEKHLKIIDFGCGKSYLTFILYYYLCYIKQMDCEIIGLDLKRDVVEHCNRVAERYGYDKLRFYTGDISKYKEEGNVDMIVTLHACDTATDYALYYAIQMKCRYIFSVPCCQHELNLQITKNAFPLVTRYGILKERMSAIYTDAIRANILKYCGYQTQVLEFIDFDASPKNLLIRAVLGTSKPDENLKKEVEELMEKLSFKQTLYELVFKK